MTVTKILGEQSGIQYQGVVDKSEADPRDNLINALFTGEFKNGPFNKPFKVTQANMRAKLGFDSDSLQYQAIQDALNAGVPFVWVMRVNGDEGPSEPGDSLEPVTIAKYYNQDVPFGEYSISYRLNGGPVKVFTATVTSNMINYTTTPFAMFTQHLNETSGLGYQLVDVTGNSTHTGAFRSRSSESTTIRGATLEDGYQILQSVINEIEFLPTINPPQYDFITQYFFEYPIKVRSIGVAKWDSIN